MKWHFTETHDFIHEVAQKLSERSVYLSSPEVVVDI